MTDILIVGDFLDDEDQRKGRPFSGTDGGLIRGLLSQSGIEDSAYKCITVFPSSPPSGRIENWLTSDRAEGVPNFPPFAKGKYVHRDRAYALSLFGETVRKAQPKVILALGNIPFWALTGKTGIDKNRGAPFFSREDNIPVIPTWAPSSIFKQWELRPITLMDFYKAKIISQMKRFTRPARVIRLLPTIADLEDFYLSHIRTAPFIAVDIETKNNQITEIGFATSPQVALVIPFYSRSMPDGNYWRSHYEEMQAWAFVRRVLEEKPSIGQNFQYDMTYLYAKYGIPVPKFSGDTMLLAHALQPELKKSLGFLGSIYTFEPPWKFMRTDHTTLKKGDEE